MSQQLKQEYERFLVFIKESGKKNAGKTVAIKGDEILGVFENYSEAANAVYAEHTPGTVLVQEVRESVEALTAAIHTPFSR